MEDPHQVLGVRRDATPSEIKTAYRKLAKEYHPDRNKRESATAKFRRITEAYEQLLNPTSNSRTSDSTTRADSEREREKDRARRRRRSGSRSPPRRRDKPPRHDSRRRSRSRSPQQRRRESPRRDRRDSRKPPPKPATEPPQSTWIPPMYPDPDGPPPYATAEDEQEDDTIPFFASARRPKPKAPFRGPTTDGPATPQWQSSGIPNPVWQQGVKRSRNGQGWAADTTRRVDVTLAEFFCGATKPIQIRAYGQCDSCRGTDSTGVCEHCNGRGAFFLGGTCLYCNNLPPASECSSCNGAGVRRYDKTIDLVIDPSDSRPGDVVRFDGQGESLGGDLVVTLNDVGDVIPDMFRATPNLPRPLFRRVGARDLECEIPMTLAEILRGTDFCFRHLDNSTVRVKMPEDQVLQPGEGFLLRNMGMPSSGDLLVRPKWIMPEKHVLDSTHLKSVLSRLPSIARFQGKVDKTISGTPADYVRED